MLVKYSDFLIEKELKEWMYLYNQVNESIDNSNLIKRVSGYISDSISNNTLSTVLKKIFKFFANKKNILVSIVLILMTYFGMTIHDIESHVGKNINTSNLVNNVKIKYQKQQKDLSSFLDSLGQRESGNDPGKINKFGYIGKYQFGKSALKEVGLDKKIDKHKFKKNPKMWSEKSQDIAMVNLLKKNVHYLGDYIDNYDGNIINGIKVTKSGMLAASHLLGASNVKKYLDSKGQKDPKDGFGTHLSSYLKRFSGYNLDNIVSL
jgi:hypothetical protein